MVSGPYSSGYYVPAPGNSMTEVIMRAFVPSDITSMITDVLTIKATGGENQSIVTNVTVTTVERIAVFKEVRTDGDYMTRVEVKPSQGHVIDQRIRFYNNGPESVKEVYIYDFIPRYTAYVANSAINTDDYKLSYSTDGGVTWHDDEPPSSTVPSVTNLRWRYNKNGGVLTPGDEHVITFQLRIK